MVGHKDFDVNAGNLKWIQPSELTAIGDGRYITPDKYHPGTLLVMYRGLPLARENDDGYSEIDDETFQMNEFNGSSSSSSGSIVDSLDWIMVGYLAKP